MPMVKVDIWEGRDDATKEALIKNISEAVVKSLNCPWEAVHVVITEVPKKHWGIAGVPASKRGS